MIIFAYIFTALMILISIFQLSLVLGAPLGELTMGGKFQGKLPIKMRILAFVQIIILLLFSLIIIARLSIAFEAYYKLSRIGIWFVFAFFIFGTFINLISPSKKEKLVMGPLNIIALLCSFLVAMS